MKLTVKHYLDIYQTRLSMQEAGITDPQSKIKELTLEVVSALSVLPLDAEIRRTGNSFFDAKGNLIFKLADQET